MNIATTIGIIAGILTILNYSDVFSKNNKIHVVVFAVMLGLILSVIILHI